jgi:hypothetical protein
MKFSTSMLARELESGLQQVLKFIGPLSTSLLPGAAVILNVYQRQNNQNDERFMH